MTTKKFQPRRPDFALRATQATEGKRSDAIGCAWWSEDKTHLNIRLGVGVALNWDDNLYITMWPVEGLEPGTPAK